MNEKQYKLLCEACDRVLMLPDTTIARVAIAWLHIVREHPAFLSSYESLFCAGERVRAHLQTWAHALRNGAGWFWQLGRAIRSDGRPWASSRDLPNRVDVLFVSHLINGSHVGQAVDFYYGNVPNELATRGYSVAIALINHTNEAVNPLASKWVTDNVPRILLSRSLGIAAEISIFQSLFGEARRLRKLAKQETPSLYRSVLYRASLEALSGGGRTTLRIGEQIRALVGKHRPKAIVVTHEGHAWERVAFAAARNASRTIRCVGYQHAALFRLQHAIRRNLANEYNPDHIQTAGLISLNQLKHAPNLPGLPISVLGSNRSYGEQARVPRTTSVQKQSVAAMPVCIVLPEGIASECHFLFEFSADCARACPDVQFIWRLHPILDFKSVIAKNPKLEKLPENVKLSRAGLDEDIARSRWALYRGTTAIVQAVMAGLRPIYLSKSDEMTIDPLYELEKWRMEIATVGEFEQTIRRDLLSFHLPPELDTAHAKKYCGSFFVPLDAGAMEAVISDLIEMRDSPTEIPS